MAEAYQLLKEDLLKEIKKRELFVQAIDTIMKGDAENTAKGAVASDLKTPVPPEKPLQAEQLVQDWKVLKEYIQVNREKGLTFGEIKPMAAEFSKEHLDNRLSMQKIHDAFRSASETERMMRKEKENWAAIVKRSEVSMKFSP